MTDLNEIQITSAIADSYWSESLPIRYVIRDGEKVLQFAELRRYHEHVETVWVDVPLADEQLQP